MQRTLIVAALLAVAACGDAADQTLASLPHLPGAPPEKVGPLPELDPARVSAGEALYLQHCAACHGTDLRGDPDWQAPNDDGSYRPPPQDGSGHTWHHADQLLVEIVADGSDFPKSRMPAFGERLSDDQILSILDYFKSTWGPDERAVQWEQTVRAREGS